MKRQVSIEEIWDGRFYSANDMVKAGCEDCKGCSDCCKGMGNTIILDPLDVSRLCEGLHTDFEGLLGKCLELNVVDGVILPNLRQAGNQEACTFLNGEGRCSVHPYRPGVCRLFPLGRFYENGRFQYFLQAGECKKEARTKVKVKKWLDTPELKKYEAFVNDWHYFLEAVEHLVGNLENEALAKKVNLYLLQTFYMTPYSGEQDFYEQFAERLKAAKQFAGIAQGGEDE